MAVISVVAMYILYPPRFAVKSPALSQQCQTMQSICTEVATLYTAMHCTVMLCCDGTTYCLAWFQDATNQNHNTHQDQEVDLCLVSLMAVCGNKSVTDDEMNFCAALHNWTPFCLFAIDLSVRMGVRRLSAMVQHEDTTLQPSGCSLMLTL